MNDQPTKICPDCRGRKREIVHLRTITGGRWQHMDCLFCGGSGVVTIEQAAKWRDGERLRNDRKARIVTLREEAKRLGITARELSDREWGKT